MSGSQGHSGPERPKPSEMRQHSCHLNLRYSGWLYAKHVGYACLNPCMCFRFIHRKWNRRWHLFRKCRIRLATQKHWCAVEQGAAPYSKAEPSLTPKRNDSERMTIYAVQLFSIFIHVYIYIIIFILQLYYNKVVLFILSHHHLRKVTRCRTANKLKYKTGAESKPHSVSQGWPLSWSLRKPPELSDQHCPSTLSKHSPGI